MRRIALPAALVALSASGVLATVASPAGASPSSSRASATAQRVTVVLQPQDRAALRSLARGHGQASTAALAAALPSRAAATEARAVLEGLGFTVDRVTALTVEAIAPAERVRAAFGSARSVRAAGKTAQALPHLPAGLHKVATVAFGGDDDRPAFRPAVSANPDVNWGPDMRAEYSSTALGSASPGVAIATVQLSDWNSADLTTYAHDIGGPTPKLTQINDSEYPAVLSPDDSVEVDLDQEAIYAIAPGARQRLYKSANKLGGMYNSLLQIADDALDGVDDNIVAASISWGFCESTIGVDAAGAQQFTAFEDLLSYVAATGVTVFAASGDDGSACDSDGDGGKAPVLGDVNYPASSPQVVAVGGTSGTGAGRTSWDDQTSGSGGGASSVFLQPGWQRADTGTQTGRAVPDIAALAGSPGLDVYSSTDAPAGYRPAFGTSLASPVAAATFATSLATAAGHPFGIGAIGPDLYSSPIHTTGFNDVTVSGDQGGPVGPAADAAPGWDAATGLGTPKWDTITGLLPGTPHITPTGGLGGSATRYVKSTTVPFRITKSLRGADDGTAARYRVDDVSASNPNCTIGVGTAAADTSPSFTGTYDVTLGDTSYASDPDEGPGYYDGIYTLAVIEQNSADCRVGLRNIIVDTTRPVISSAPGLRPYVPAAGGSPSGRLVASWGGSDDLSGISKYNVIIKRRSTPTGADTVVAQISTTSTWYAFPVSTGYYYTAAVQAVDKAGNNSYYGYSSRTSTWDSNSLSYSSGWSTNSSTGDYFGSVRYTGTAGRTAVRKSVTGKAYWLIARTGPNYGKLQVTIAGYTRTIDLYSSTLKQRVLIYFYTGSTVGARNVYIKALGTKNSKSKGTLTVIDGLLMHS